MCEEYTITLSASDLGSSLGGRVSDEDRLVSTSSPPTEADVQDVRPVPPIVHLDGRP